jgi:hypothetical protein
VSIVAIVGRNTLADLARNEQVQITSVVEMGGSRS